MKKYLVVAYDITDNKRRNKICDILSVYGQRVNYSVFECFLGAGDIFRLKNKIEGYLEKGKDSVLYYYLCKDCIEKVERVGNFPEEKSVVKTF